VAFCAAGLPIIKRYQSSNEMIKYLVECTSVEHLITLVETVNQTVKLRV
jgi:hypothetical protein